MQSFCGAGWVFPKGCYLLCVLKFWLCAQSEKEMSKKRVVDAKLGSPSNLFWFYPLCLDSPLPPSGRAISDEVNQATMEKSMAPEWPGQLSFFHKFMEVVTVHQTVCSLLFSDFEHIPSSAIFSDQILQFVLQILRAPWSCIYVLDSFMSIWHS